MSKIIINNELQSYYDKEDFAQALLTLQNGGIILYPTDTIWGIGCDARNEKAVKRIYELKKREDTKSMLCLLDSSAKLRAYIKEVPEMAYDLIEMTSKPMTIIYDGAQNVAPNLIANDGSIGIRITEERFTKMLCSQLHAPIVSTSANISGEPSPKCFKEISNEIIEGVDYVVKFRQKEVSESVPSSIIKLSQDNVFKIIRQ